MEGTRDRDLLNSLHSDGAIVVTVSFRIPAGISSGPVALFGSSDFRTASTSPTCNTISLKEGSAAGNFPRRYLLCPLEEQRTLK